MEHKERIKRVAEAHDVDPQVVEDLVSYLWLLVIRCFNDNRMPSIKLPGLGLFHVKPTKLKRLLNAMEKPDYKWKHDNHEEYRARIRAVYDRRIVEEYSNFTDRYIPVTIRQDVIKMREKRKL